MMALLASLNEILRPEFKVFLTAAVPVLELKAAVPLGIGLGMHPLHALLVAYLGSLLPVPFLFLCIRPILFRIKKIERLRVSVEAFEAKTIHKSVKIQKYGAVGLLMFVGVPLPGTGVWTGSLGAVLLDIRFKWALPAICLGNAIAGVLILLLSGGALGIFGYFGL